MRSSTLIRFFGLCSLLIGFSAGAVNEYPYLLTPKLDAGNVRVTGNTLSTLNTNGDFTIAPNGSGATIFSTLSATTVPYLDASKKLTSSSVTPTQLALLSSATNANTPSTLVLRDGSGNFSAGTITASLTGNISGNAATVTTNANLTGPITSSGNATTVASQTGTGSKFVMDTSPVLVTPNLGTPSTLVGTNISGTGASFTAGNVTTNANLTGPVTSVGNATTITAASVTNAMLAGSIDLTTKVTGTLPIANGGTNNGSLGVTAGSMYYADGSKLVSMGTGSSGQVPVSSGATVVWGTNGGASGTFVGPTFFEQTTPSTIGTYNLNNAFLISAGNATIGATYTDSNSTTFTVYATVASSTLVYMRGAIAPVASGTLTKTGGTGDATLTYSAYKPPVYIKAYVQGGGGGGGGTGTGTSGTAGGGGGSAIFGLITCTGGNGGAKGSSGGASTPSAAGSCTGANYANFPGNAGNQWTDNGAHNTTGATGAASPMYGGAGAGGAIAGTGSAGRTCGAGGGAGGGGGSVALPGSGASGGLGISILSPPSLTYSWSLGVAGTAGTAGTSGPAGGAGGQPCVIVEEYYQ